MKMRMNENGMVVNGLTPTKNNHVLSMKKRYTKNSNNIGSV